ncbi:MAG: radical SAM protein [archaeon]
MVDVVLVFPRFNYRNFGPPLGALYLSRVLKDGNFSFEFIDGTVVSYEKTVSKILELKPKFLLLSVHTVFADNAEKLVREVKKKLPEIKVIVGGVHATIMPEKVMAWKGLNYLIVGEAEEVLPKLLENPEKFDKVCQGNQVKDLNKINFPLWNVLPEEYFMTGNMSVITSRGCPFNCAFCQPTLNKLFGKGFRQRSPENVLKELLEIKKVFNEKGFALKKISFTDDGLTFKKDFLKKLSELLIENKYNVVWLANTRADTMPDKELILLMKKSGFRGFSIGVESGNDVIRNEVLKKNLKKQAIIDAFKLCHETSVESEAYIMVGSPKESWQTIKETVELLDVLQPTFSQVTITSPLPETYLYDFAVENNLIEVKSWADFGYGDESHLKLENFSKQEIKRIQKAITYAIYFHEKFRKLKYSTLFYFFLNPVVNKSFISLQALRFKLKKLIRKG